MAKRSWNYWKKPVPHKPPMQYIEDPDVIKSYSTDLELVEKYYTYSGLILPNRVIKGSRAYEITYVHPILYINGFLVITENDLVQTIILFGQHPNRDPETYHYCMPDYKKGVVYDNTYYHRLVTNLKTYYLDDCYFVPSGQHLKYKRLTSFTIK